MTGAQKTRSVRTANVALALIYASLFLGGASMGLILMGRRTEGWLLMGAQFASLSAGLWLWLRFLRSRGRVS